MPTTAYCAYHHQGSQTDSTISAYSGPLSVFRKIRIHKKIVNNNFFVSDYTIHNVLNCDTKLDQVDPP